ncbi:MAG: site-specific integrase, partial [Paracoccaceae bacterium]
MAGLKMAREAAAGPDLSAGLRDALSGWCDHLRALQGASPHTLRAYLADVTGFLSFLALHHGESLGTARVTAVSQSGMRAFMAHERGRGLGPRSLSRSLSAVK